MGRFSKALDSATDRLHRAGEAVAGDKGARAANEISSAVLGREVVPEHLEPCSAACGWCSKH
ncbi:hypothetical protein [Streptomyces decoyicus]|uniref:hypothetical protein n=1 Tax=Streptomyces decoyicus TaxID=249567 RepID=UPI0033B1F8EE